MNLVCQDDDFRKYGKNAENEFFLNLKNTTVKMPNNIFF